MKRYSQLKKCYTFLELYPDEYVEPRGRDSGEVERSDVGPLVRIAPELRCPATADAVRYLRWTRVPGVPLIDTTRTITQEAQGPRRTVPLAT